MNTRTRATGASVLIALGSLAVTLLLLASPAGAAPSQNSGESEAVNGSVSSGTCLAVNDSTCSGSGVAVNDSVSSGDAVAVNGSTASGCSVAADVATASGGDCAPTSPATEPDRDRAPGPDRDRAGGTGASVTKAAGVASPTAATGLAFTGSATGPLTALAVALLVLGMVLVTLGSDRRRPVHSS